MSWTKKQFDNAMHKANWENIGQGCWVHNVTAAKFYALTVTRWRTERYSNGAAWYPFALAEETPTEAPF